MGTDLGPNEWHLESRHTNRRKKTDKRKETLKKKKTKKKKKKIRYGDDENDALVRDSMVVVSRFYNEVVR